MQIMKKSLSSLAIALTCLACASAPVLAQERGAHAMAEHAPMREHEGPRMAPGHAMGPALQLDQRYHHDHYYPYRGQAVARLPGGSVSIGFRDTHWFFHGGVWFQPLGAQFVVALPPIGIVTPMLPPAYATLWIGGAPYYYANGVYYAASPGQGYVVVAPPPGADTVQPVASAPMVLPDPIVYPRAGQSAVQAQADQHDCRRWAMAQPHAMSDASVVQRAESACMDGRGYTVR